MPDMQWWREARFGMFIHWGIYAVAAGRWKGEFIPSLGEWIMYNARIPVEEYERLAGRFNPVEFDAEQWVSLAERAGMKYLVITAKHHDGFAMFDSPCSEYDIVDATPSAMTSWPTSLGTVTFPQAGRRSLTIALDDLGGASDCTLAEVRLVPVD